MRKLGIDAIARKYTVPRPLAAIFVCANLVRVKRAGEPQRCVANKTMQVKPVIFRGNPSLSAGRRVRHDYCNGIVECE
jgi:hypothetical protein